MNGPTPLVRTKKSLKYKSMTPTTERIEIVESDEEHIVGHDHAPRVVLDENGKKVGTFTNATFSFDAENFKKSNLTIEEFVDSFF